MTCYTDPYIGQKIFIQIRIHAVSHDRDPMDPMDPDPHH